MHGFDIGVADKVLVIERQNAFNPVYAHCRDKARVVNLNAGDAMRYQKFAPLFVNGKAVREQAELFLKKLCESVCLLRREAVAIAIHRARAGIPKFADILGGVTEHAIMSKNGIRG
jgi:hypothetical protein